MATEGGMSGAGCWVRVEGGKVVLWVVSEAGTGTLVRMEHDEAVDLVALLVAAVDALAPRGGGEA